MVIVSIQAVFAIRGGLGSRIDLKKASQMKGSGEKLYNNSY